MAVNVSKIPNRKDFDAVREAILEVDNNINEIIEGEGLVSDVNGIAGSVNITGSAVSTNVGTSTITISANEANDGILTLQAGTGVSISTPNTFSADQSTNRTITITNAAPDQVVVLTDSTNIDFTGTYPNFSGDLKSNVTISGTLTAGNLTTGGTLTATDVVADTGDFSTSLTINGDSVVTELIAKGAITFEGVQEISADTDTWGAVAETWETSTLPDDTTSYTILHQDTSSQSDVYNTGGNVIQSIGLDTYGHLGSIGSVDLDQRYLAFKTINVGGTALDADAYNDTLSITSSDGITLTTGDDSFNIVGDDKFKFIYTEDDAKTLSPSAFNSTLTLNGSPSISVSSDTDTNTVSFALSLNDISFDNDGNRIARGLLYYQQAGEPLEADKPDGTFNFTNYTISLTGANANDWSENPPQSGSPSVTLYVLKYESVDTGGGSESARTVDFGDIQSATGFEAPVTFSDFTSGGRTIIDGGIIRTGAISSNGFVVGSTPTDYSTEGTKWFLEGNAQNAAGDIISEQFKITSGNAFFKGSVTVGSTELTEANTLNSNTTASDVSGLGSLALLDSVDATSSEVTGLAALAFLANIDLSYVTDAGDLAAIDRITTGNATTYIDDDSIVTQLVAANAIVADKIAANAITAGKLATNAIQSNNLNPLSPLPTDFTTAGTYLDLANGNFYSQEFKIVSGSATFKGSLDVADGTFSVNSSTGVITAGLVNISEDTITINSDDAAFSTAGQIIFNDETETEFAAIKGVSVSGDALALQISSDNKVVLGDETITIGHTGGSEVKIEEENGITLNVRESTVKEIKYDGGNYGLNIGSTAPNGNQKNYVRMPKGTNSGNSFTGSPIMQWGYSGQTSVVFDFEFPNAVQSIQVQPTANETIYVATWSTTGFTASRDDYFWVAYGY